MGEEGAEDTKPIMGGDDAEAQNQPAQPETRTMRSSERRRMQNSPRAMLDDLRSALWA